MTRVYLLLLIIFHANIAIAQTIGTQDSDVQIEGFRPFASDLYERLGLNSRASKSEIVARCREAAKVFHPDRNSSPQFADYFVRVWQAASVLRDPEKRARYDKTGAIDDWVDYESAASFNRDLYGILKSIFQIYASAGPFSESLMADALSLWAQQMQIAEVRKLFMEIAHGQLFPNVGNSVRFAALHAMAHYIVVPEFRQALMEQLRTNRLLDSMEVEAIIRGIVTGLEHYDASVNNMREELLGEIRRIANGSRAPEFRAAVLAGVSNFVPTNSSAADWIFKETRTVEYGEACKAAAIELVLGHPLLRARITTKMVQEWLAFAKAVIRRESRGLSSTRRHRASAAAASRIFSGLAKGDAPLNENGLNVEAEERGFDYDRPEERTRAIRAIKSRYLLPAVIRPGSRSAPARSKTLAQVAERVEEAAGLPEGAGSEVLVSNPGALIQIAQAQAISAEVLAKAQARALQIINNATRGMRVTIGFSACEGSLGTR